MAAARRKKFLTESENKEAAPISDRVWAEGGWFNMYQFLLFAFPHESLIVSAWKRFIVVVDIAWHPQLLICDTIQIQIWWDIV